MNPQRASDRPEPRRLGHWFRDKTNGFLCGMMSLSLQAFPSHACARSRQKNKATPLPESPTNTIRAAS